ncbi:WD40-like beta-propeller protein [Thermus phage TSP4]|nr:WD40-like beta-propeller protein [Thermus phage TSP4]
MIRPLEFALWPFTKVPKPNIPALALTLGPDAVGGGLPFTKVYALARESDGVYLYKDEERTHGWTLPSNLNTAYNDRLTLAFDKDGLWVAIQNGSVGGSREEPQGISVFKNGELIYSLQGYDPQLVYTALAFQEEEGISLECLASLSSVLLFYMDLDSKTLKVRNGNSDTVLKVFDYPHRLVKAVPVRYGIQLWLVDEAGEWVGALADLTIIQPRLKGEVDGPEVWNNPQDGSWVKVFGRKWLWRVDKNANAFVFTSGNESYSVSVPHSLAEVCFASAAFDHVGYPTVAYQLSSGTYVTYWDILSRQYVTTPWIPVRFPLLFQQAVIPAYRYTPGADIFLLGVNGGVLEVRNQAGNYASVVFSVDVGNGVVPTEIKLRPLKYQVETNRGIKYTSGLYPYFTIGYLAANEASFRIVPDQFFKVEITDADISFYDIVKPYSASVSISAGLNDAFIAIYDIVKAYQAYPSILAQLNDAEVSLRTVTQLYNASASLSINLVDASTELKQVAFAYPMSASMSVSLSDADVVLS